MTDITPKSEQTRLHQAVQEFYHATAAPIETLAEHLDQLQQSFDAVLKLCEGQQLPIPDTLRGTHRDAARSARYGLDELRSHRTWFHDKYRALNPPDLSEQEPWHTDTPPSRRVLIVDDDLLNREITADLVRARNYAVDCAEDGDTAIALASEHRYDLILMDCNMPNVNGFDATREILARQHQRPPVVVAVTATSQEEYFAPGLAAGMEEFVPKPVNVATLDRLLNKYSPRI